MSESIPREECCEDRGTEASDSSPAGAWRARRAALRRRRRRCRRSRYMPGAVDFEQPLGGAREASPTAASPSAPGQGAVSFRSGVIEAPERFDLAGLAGETRPLEMRARERGGEWTRWTVADDGNPVYFGERRRAPGPGARLAPAGDPPLRQRLRHDQRLELAADRLPLRRQLARSSPPPGVLAPHADAAPIRPAMVTRAQWGAELAKGGCPPRERRRLRAGQGRRRPPHGDRAEVHRGRGAGDRARDLPLPPQRERLERHRLQRPRRPLRDPLRRPRRRRPQGRDRRPLAGLQRNDDRDRVDRHPHRPSVSPRSSSRRSPPTWRGS